MDTSDQPKAKRIREITIDPPPENTKPAKGAGKTGGMDQEKSGTAAAIQPVVKGQSLTKSEKQKARMQAKKNK